MLLTRQAMGTAPFRKESRLLREEANRCICERKLHSTKSQSTVTTYSYHAESIKLGEGV